MTQNIIGVNNHTNTLGTRNSLQDFTTVFMRQFKDEGIIDGLTVTSTSPDSAAIDIKKGSCAIDANGRLMFFRLLDDITNLAVPNTGSAKYYLVALKIDLTNATQEIIVEEGSPGTDPTLTEGGSPEVYYLVLARIDKVATTSVSDGEIIQDGVTITNNGDNEVIGKFSGEDGWIHTDETWSFDTSTTFTIVGNKVTKYSKGMKVKFDQSQAYTNDPASGSSITLNMTDTSSFVIGNEVLVSSSAGQEYATIDSIVTNTSITVDSLSLDHTTSSPLVTCTKYFEIDSVAFSVGTTTVTLVSTTVFNLVGTTISNNFFSPVKSPYKYNEFVSDSPTSGLVNKIINGNFDIWQRGTSFTDPADNVYTADRFRVDSAADGGTFPTLIHSRQTITPGDTDRSFYYYQVNTDGAGTSLGANSVYAFGQLIEFGTQDLAGLDKTVTVSFRARSNISGKKIGIWISQNYGTGGSPSSAEDLNGTNFVLTSDWTNYSYTFTTNTLVGKTFGTNNDNYLHLLFNLQWGSSQAARVGDTVSEDFVGAGNIEVDQVQLVPGNTTSEFPLRSIPQEELLAKRYCWVVGKDISGNDSGRFLKFANGGVQSATIAQFILQFPTQMRVSPSLTESGNFRIVEFNNTVYAISGGISLTASTTIDESFTSFEAVSSGMTANIPCFIQKNSDSTANIVLDAEL